MQHLILQSLRDVTINLTIDENVHRISCTNCLQFSLHLITKVLSIKMSESDEENYFSYGTPLEPYDEDEFPKKKALTIEEQIATDSQGRRRFHGAFTGGFSAGFCNTVGSLEGWTPSEFKSSRKSKALKSSQRPEDFMDDEDIGEFGIAPTRVRATSDYNMVSSRKRKIQPQDGPIPGRPVLEMILQPAKETVGVRLLKQMGWKPGQGVGPRLTKHEKKRIGKRLTGTKMYGCEMPGSSKQTRNVDLDDDGSSSNEDAEITFAPDDYDMFVCVSKDNVFGMGYTGLDKRPILSRFSLFDRASHFSMVDRNNKKVSISGQAFGVGALEDDDEDIYGKDDMSQYDFELVSAEQKKQAKKNIVSKSDTLPGFILAKNLSAAKKVFPPPVLPKNFVPIHGARKSRFEPLSEEKQREFLENSKRLERNHLNAADRQSLINETTVPARPNVGEPVVRPKEDRAESSDVNKNLDRQSVVENVETAVSEKQTTNISASFKPFVYDADKQERYEKYLDFIKIGSREKLVEVQPLSMTEWERDRERVEFEQAAKMFKPFADLMFDRFVPATQKDDLNALSIKNEPAVKEESDAVIAAKKKMFGKLTRERIDWKPTSLLCKRFNIPEPNTGCQPPENDKKGKRYSVFDYLQVKTANEIHDSPALKPEEKIDTAQNDQEKSVEDNERTNKTEDLNTIDEKNKDISISSSSRNIEPSLPTSNVPSSGFKQQDTTAHDHENPTKNHSILKETIPVQQNVRATNQVQNKPTDKNIAPVVPDDPSARIDLFKAIFLSSSESESEPENNQDSESKLDKMKQILITESYTKEEKSKGSNLKRNDSSPQGIFKNIDLDAINVRTKKPHTDINVVNISECGKKTDDPVKSDLNENTYGPRLPKQIIKTDGRVLSNDRTPQSEDWIEKKNNSESGTDSEKERSFSINKRKKEKKKHKKHKEKYKKHKSKSKHKKHKHKE